MIYLTGSSGFIGSYIQDHLSSERYNISPLNRSVMGLSHSEDLDVSNEDVVAIHCAGIAHKNDISRITSFIRYYDGNVVGTENLLRNLDGINLKRFIYVSSVSVFEQQEMLHKNTRLNPQDCNGISKFLTEKLIKDYCSRNNVEFVIIRAPLVYGEGVKANFAALFELASKGLPLPLGGITKNKRSLVSLYNLADLIKVCIGHPNAANQTFLVSDDDDLSTAEMVKLMARVQDKKPLLLPIPVWLLKLLGKLVGKSGVVIRLIDSLQVDISYTKDTLDWRPPYSVEYGFSKCKGRGNV